jgi:hypothetical protein
MKVKIIVVTGSYEIWSWHKIMIKLLISMAVLWKYKDVVPQANWMNYII